MEKEKELAEALERAVREFLSFGYSFNDVDRLWHETRIKIAAEGWERRA